MVVKNKVNKKEFRQKNTQKVLQHLRPKYDERTISKLIYKTTHVHRNAFVTIQTVTSRITEKKTTLAADFFLKKKSQKEMAANIQIVLNSNFANAKLPNSKVSTRRPRACVLRHKLNFVGASRGLDARTVKVPLGEELF